MKTETGGNWVMLPKGTKVIMGIVNEDNTLIENKEVILEESWSVQLGSGKLDMTITDVVVSTYPV